MLDEAHASSRAVHVPDLIAKDRSVGPHALWQEYLGGPRVCVAGYRTDDGSLILFVKTGTRKYDRGPTTALLRSENRIEIRPDDVTRV